MFGLGKKQPDQIDTLVQAMGRAIRVDGAPTQDSMLKVDIHMLIANLEVIARKSQLLDSPELTQLRKEIQILDRHIHRIRREQGISNA
jgi:hypothetical protein